MINPLTTLGFWWWCWRNRLNPWHVHRAIERLARRMAQSRPEGK